MNLPNSRVGLLDSNIGMQKHTANYSTNEAASYYTNPSDGMTRCQVRFANCILVTFDYIKPAYTNRPKRANEQTSAAYNNEKNHRGNNGENVPRAIEIATHDIIP